ncbi:hypothetical protein KKHLCK_17100 [Candidatus Electrothrix laxa]
MDYFKPLAYFSKGIWGWDNDRPKPLSKSLIWLLILTTGSLICSCAHSPVDNNPNRGATNIPAGQERFGDNYTKFFPDKNSNENWQGWEPKDSMWFYTTTQGSNLLPYDFFMVLEQTNSTNLFRSAKNIDYYRYIPLKITDSNPDGLPLGMVKDTYKGKEYMGFTCAACHTNQINYKGTAIRVDGAPTLADMETFIEDLTKALKITRDNEEKKKRFVAAVMQRNSCNKLFYKDEYCSEEVIENDLKKFTLQLESYVTINKSVYHQSKSDQKPPRLKYGYGRLDAFGRIYNRTLQNVLNEKAVEAALKEVIGWWDGDNSQLTKKQKELKKLVKKNKGLIITNSQFDYILTEIIEKKLLPERQIDKLREILFNSPNAPVSYPFLWDTPQADYVQWNGIGANAGLGALGRNVGEVIGVFGTLDWEEQEGFNLISWLLGQKKKQIKYASSVDKHNLEELEKRIKKLQSPQWAAVDVLPAINHDRAKRGKKLFKENCASCHNDIKRDAPERKVIANFTRINKDIFGKGVETDPAMGTNAVTYSGYSGITSGQYLDRDVGNIFIQKQAPVAAILTIAAKNTVATPDTDRPFFYRWALLFEQLIKDYWDNEIEPSIKMGDYNPDTTAKPFNSLLSYKARPLNGIWATAPYLHNGSVPTLYDLLLPKEERPVTFYIGSREFDAQKVGFISDPNRGWKFDTRLPGNGNSGHDSYGEKKFTKQQRLDLVEYMKSL